MKYYISKISKDSFESVLERLAEALKMEGFGVIFDFNVHDKFKEALQVDFRKYKIIGVCNPAFAYQALLKEDKVGTMLPCSIIVQELPDGRIEVAAIDPYAAMQAVGNDDLNQIAKQVKIRLEKVINLLYK